MRFIERLHQAAIVGLARDWSFVPKGGRAGGEAQRLLVIARQMIPTIDYYLRDIVKIALLGLKITR